MIGIIDCRPKASAHMWAGIQPEMLEFFDRPLLQHAVEQMVQAGVTHCVLITEDTSAVMQRWGTGERWGCTFSAIRPYAITSFIAGLGEQLVMVGRGDCIPCITGIHLERLPQRATQLIFRQSVGDNIRTSIFTGWAMTQPQTLLSQCFATGGADGLLELQHTTAVQVVNCVCSHSPGAFLRSQQMILDAAESALIFHGMEMRSGVWAARNAAVHSSVKVIGKVYISENVRVGSGVTLVGPVVIGRDSVVDSGAVISDSSVQPGTFIGRGMGLLHDVVMPGTVIRAQHGVAVRVDDPRLLASTNLSLMEYLKALTRVLRTEGNSA